MISSSPQVALCALIALLASCSSGGRSTRTESAPKPVVTSEDIEHNAGQPIEQVLQSKFPALIVARAPDGGVTVRIRGYNSFFSGGEPLYVIDDVPITPGPGGALTGLNPHDIDTMKVLINPAETAIYGVRGANGVILITTKRPTKNPN